MTLFCYKQKEMKTEVHVDALLHISVGGLSIAFHINLFLHACSDFLQ